MSANTLTTGEEGTTILFVPVLQGEIVTGFGIHSRKVLSNDGAPNPRTMASGLIGYRHYFDDVGRFGLGFYAAGSTSLNNTVGRFDDFSGGLSFQYRAMSPDFIFALIGAFAQVGALWAPISSTPNPIDGSQDTLDEVGLRMVVGIEGGFGFLGYLDPYIYGESGVSLGMEFINVGGLKATSLLFAYQIRLDFALR